MGLLLQAFLLLHSQPNKPTLYLVSVDPETGCDVITWLPSATPPAFDEYWIGMVELPNPNEPPVLVNIGIVSNSETQYINCNTFSNVKQVGYSVWAHTNPLINGEFDPPDSTILLTTDFDSCQATITLSWTGYNKWRNSTDEYNIYRRTAPGVYNLLATVPGTENTYVISTVTPNQTYELFVEAVNSDRVRRSNSNRVDVQTTMSNQPNNVNADFATISPANTIDISFTVLGTPVFAHYNLVRSNSPDGPYTLVQSFDTDDSHIYYTDDIPFTSGVYYYRLEGINNCNQASSLSNRANNILLSGTLSGSQVTLGWNAYYDWSGGVENYRIIRISGRENPVADTLPLGITTIYNEDLSTLANYADPISSLVCYQVAATENTNVYGIQGESYSNRLCFSVYPDIRMPNAIIPNDGDETNRALEPVFSFLPEQYDLIIYNRLGTKIWEGSSPWDGQVNGQFVPEGVYIYYLRIYNYSTEYIELNGKVTVVYR